MDTLLAETDAVSSPYTQYALQFYSAFPWVGLLLLMMTLDIISGIIAAVIERKLSSKIGYRGMMRKALCLIVVGVAAILEQGLMLTLPESIRGDIAIPLAKLTAGFFFINETLSVLENARRSGVPLPAFLSKSLIDTLARMANQGSDSKEIVHLELKQGSMDAEVRRDPVSRPPKDTAQ